jgi:signal transduction histidine kinase
VASYAGAVAIEAGNGAATQNFSDSRTSVVVFTAVWVIAFPGVGALIAWRRPDNAFGWLLLGSMTLVGVSAVAHGWALRALRVDPGSLPGGTATGRVAAWVATWLFAAGVGLLPYVAATFPTGVVRGRWLRRTARAGAVGLGALVVAQAFAPDVLDGVAHGVRPIANPLGVPALKTPIGVVTAAGSVLLLAFFVFAVGDLVVRCFRAPAPERRRLRGLALALGFLVGCEVLSGVAAAANADPLAALLQNAGQLGAIAGCAAALALALLREELYGLSGFTRRLLTGAVLSSAVVVAYVAVVALVTRVTSSTGAVPPVVAAAVFAVALGPLRGRLQRAVDHLLFGWRAEPQRVLTELGEQLAATPAPDEVLPRVVETVARTMRLPYARVDLGSDDEAVTAASYGRPVSRVTSVPLVHQDRVLGALVVGHRSGEEPFRPDELALLRGLAAQTGAAAHGVLLTEALRVAHERTVRGREDERRRLRRELHDGLGPALAGLSLQLDAALAADSAGETDALLLTMRGHLRTTVGEVRRIVHDLRPPALDDLGLLGALREQAAALASGSPSLDVALDLPATAELPAAVEVAVYRIASEALTNVVRHSGAGHCTVRLSLNGAVELDVTDDGGGVRDRTGTGVGLRSMRERAEELGGTCDVLAAEPHGTRVQVRLP